jgi:hypothetical protein
LSAEPEWTERAQKRGLDPLGMQNAGVALYQTLLPGISNVTLRMRYYGFYCWVSDAYARSGATDDFDAWRSWVRRSEALYALVSSHTTGQGGVGGVEWADRRLALNEDVIDFAEAASSDGAERYLRQSLGVFGGAYYSQMAEVGLFRQGDHGIQRATNVAGRAAAEAFRSSIGADVEEQVLAGIRAARVRRADLAGMAGIVPSAIPQDSSERSIYEALLFPSNDATAGDGSRSSSLRLILEASQALGRRPGPDDIRWHLFNLDACRDATLDAQRLRWEAYHCQDLFQIAAAALLDWSIELMSQLDAGRTPTEIGDEVRAHLREAHAAQAELTWYGLRDSVGARKFDFENAYAVLTSRRGSATQKAWEAVALIAALDHRLFARPHLREAARREFRAHGGGRSIATELDWIGRRNLERVADLVASYVVERITLRHSWVAMQKLRRQRDYTFLFEMHEGRLVRRSGYAPVPTTPRLSPAVQFLVDIGLLSDSGLTERGVATLGSTQ